MSQDPLFILVILSMAVVLIVLMIGICGFGRGGEFNRKYANKLMRLRILAQFLAVAIILLSGSSCDQSAGMTAGL